MSQLLTTKTFGFIGTGTITEAMITGLAKTEFSGNPIVVSPRNDQVAARLAVACDQVRIGQDNQAVIDQADIVFLAVRPQIAEAVIRALRFGPHHHIISFVAGLSLETLAGWIDQPCNLVQSVPLPFVADLNGATAIFPPDVIAAEIFTALGTAVEVKTRQEYDLLAAGSALMATYFGILDTTAGWLEDKGLARPAADAYLRQLFSGLAHVGRSKDEMSFGELIHDHATKGGLNEQVLADFRAEGGVDAIKFALDRVHARIKG